MKLFFGEFKANYEKYHFPYQVWLLKEEGDTVEKIYSSGFLPIRSLKNVFYLSRNLRVNLSKFELTSENRRIINKTTNIEASFLPLGSFNYSTEVQKFCVEYVKNRFSKGQLNVGAVRAIFTDGVYNSIFEYKDTVTKKVVGYAVCFESKQLLQYGHAFYDLNLFKENIGARMMLSSLIWAKENQKDYVYLGTCYEESALYKTEFKGVEFFNGFRWSDNLDELKALVRMGNDKDETKGGQEYLLKEKDFLEKHYDPDLGNILSKYGIRINL